jgi:hypothetical protein
LPAAISTRISSSRGGDPQRGDLCLVTDEHHRRRHGYFLDHRDLARLREGQAETDADRGEQQGDQRAIDGHRVLHDEEAVLDEPQRRGEQTAGGAKEQDWTDAPPRRGQGHVEA